MAKLFPATIPAAIGRVVRTALAPPGSAIMTSKAEERIQTPGIQPTLRAVAARLIWFLPVVRARSIALLNKAEEGPQKRTFEKFREEKFLSAQYGAAYGRY